MPQFKDKPAATDLLSVSQGDIQGDYQYLEATLKKDHQIAFNNQSTDAGEGRHTQVSFTNRGGAVPLPADNTNAFLYANAGNIFFSSATVTDAQMTRAEQPVIGTSGSTFLPGGLILKWGVINFLGLTQPVVFAGGAFPNNIFALTFGVPTSTPNNNGVVGAQPLTLAGFTGRQQTAAALTAYYIAIGN